MTNRNIKNTQKVRKKNASLIKQVITFFEYIFVQHGLQSKYITPYSVHTGLALLLRHFIKMKTVHELFHGVKKGDWGADCDWLTMIK